MSVADLNKAAGGLLESADITSAELRRLQPTRDGALDITYSDVRFDSAGNVIGNARLQSRDIITVREVPDWNREDRIEIRGEVIFPGIYRNLTRRDDISGDRARGWITMLAFPEVNFTELLWQLAKNSVLRPLRRYSTNLCFTIVD